MFEEYTAPSKNFKDYHSLINGVLRKYSINISIEEIEQRWSEPHRYYHNLDHLVDLLININVHYQSFVTDVVGKTYDILILAAVFHDIVYYPKENNNEIKSSLFFESISKNLNKDTPLRRIIIKEVSDIIMATATHAPQNYLQHVFCDIDMEVIHRPYKGLLKWEEGIYNEYSFAEKYKEGRLAFLNSLIKKEDLNPFTIDRLEKLIRYVEEKY